MLRIKSIVKAILLLGVMMTLFTPFLYADEANYLVLQDGVDVESVDTAQESVSTDLPIYISLDPDMEEITLTNQNGVPVDLYILALDDEGLEIARWQLSDFSASEEVTLKFKDIFGSGVTHRLASVSVVSDEPIRVLEVVDTQLQEVMANSLTAIIYNGYYKPLDTYPTTGGYIGFGVLVGGSYHNGADYASTVNANVYAVLPGTVVYSGEYSGFGSLSPSTSGGAIVLRHQNKLGQYFYVIYGHLYRDSNLTPGKTVTGGQIIGTIRPFYNNGTFLPHLHLGVYTGTVFPTSGWGYSTSLTGWVDPKNYLDNNAGGSLPNLTPYQPLWWSDKIVVSKTTGTNADSSPLYTTDNLYVDWSVINNGTVSTATTFYTYLYVDGTQKASWYTNPPLNPNSSQGATDYSIGKLSAGTHTIKIVTDVTGVISESNETDNEYTKTITVQQSSVTTYTMSGTIHSGSNTGPVLAGATVSIAVKTTTSSSTGTFSITGIPAGTYAFTVSKTGYTTYTNPAYYVGSNQSGLNFYLTVPTPADVALQSGVPSNGSVSSGQWKYYYIDVPSGASKLEIKITNLSADVDMYTLYNAKPTLASYSCRPYLTGTTGETCTYTNPSAGRWWAGVYGYSSGSYSITATVTTGTATPTLRVDGSTSSTKAQGGTFSLTGANYTPNGTVSRYINGVATTSITASSSGTIAWSWPTNCTTATGTSTVYTKDNTTGKISNSITEIVTASSSCTVPQYEGWIDAADCNTINGWAWDKNQPNTPISVDIYNGSTKLATIVAGTFRQDLVNAGKGNGYHGFSYATPSSLKDGIAHSIYVKYAGTGTNLSGSPKSLTCGGTPTLLIDGGTSSTRSQGSTFSLTGANYTPNGTVLRYVNGAQISSITATSSGTLPAWTWVTDCTTATGTYTVYTKDNTTGKSSNSISEIVTASSSCNPTLLVDGGTSSTRSQGSTFTLSGANYTPNGTVLRYVNGAQISSITATSSGTLPAWTWVTDCTTATGTYTVYTKDNTTGKSSNSISEIVTASSSCNPTLLIDGGTSSTKAQGGTFITTGSKYTPNGSVTRYLKQPNGVTITLTPTLYANGSGNISWSWTSVCTSATGTSYIWVKDNSTGKTSNTVTETVTHSSSCP